MKIETRYFGEAEVEKTDIVTFADGLYGFENYKDYVIFRLDESNNTFFCLQSVDFFDLAFIITNPFEAVSGYDPKISPMDEEALAPWDGEIGLEYYAIAVVYEDASITLNLKSPLVINPTKRVGKQVILDNSSYSMRHAISNGEEA